ncbi:energy transducer TonB [Marinifilum fragile]|uniref:energy transducer TonB n=1 Tax=Marinifilum fragile TaxID=570161 RepID=UPI002AA86074|nr:energy transducer TonB [Marinifilum fragile]
MIKTILTITFSWITLLAYSQTYFEQGNKYLNEGNYFKADSMYSLVIESMPFGDAYYNRAIARMNMKDMRGFCVDMKKASSNNDKEAKNLHERTCLDIDTVFYSETYSIGRENYSFKEIIFKEKYYDLTEGFIYDKKNKEIARYRIQGNYKWFGLIPKMPEFDGGERKLLKFIKSNLKYPISEMDAYKKYAGDHATVYVQFDISKSGKVEKVEVSDEKKKHTEKYISKNFVNEALRIVKSLPDFKPGVFMDKEVVVRHIIPIKFSFPK